MPNDNRLFEDFTRMAGGAISSFTALREEMEARLREQVEHMLIGMDLVRRDEFEAVQAMAEAARTENAELTRRIKTLEAKFAKPAKAAARKRTHKPKSKGTD
ncbi:MAG: accessory factor UbiK family protein [Alphaproteobacteria bacterium]|jgi:BMFP domain-containing protein YqiC|nr:accessory factor UbiK family protein [Alphaproteobacteria bacterium]